MTRHFSTRPADIAAAADLLRAGGLVAFPTETVYGLGADATRAESAARIYAAKGRPSFNPLIAHVADMAAAEREGVFDDNARALASAFWPGPLTIVVPVREDGTVCELARAGLPSVALRIPSHPVALALLRAAGRPIAAPSANRSGHVSPTSVAHVLDDLAGAIDAVIDGGNAEVGIESTVVACAQGRIFMLRPGGVTREAIAQAAGKPVEEAADTGDSAPQSPGRLAAHYAPRAAVRLDAEFVNPGEACLAFGPAGLPGVHQACAVRNLSASGDLIEGAANLYRFLRELDATGAKAIAVAPIPSSGLGEAIMDRLKRAAVGSPFLH